MLARSAVTLDMVRSAVSGRYFERGLRYQNQGRARITGQSADGDRLEGTVRGSRPAPYRVQVFLGPADDGADVEGMCSCPIGYNCKHVAALLIESLASRQRRREAPATVDPLTPGLRDWLTALDRSTATATDDYPPDIRHRLLYVLSMSTDMRGATRLLVGPRSVRLLKDGGYSHKVAKYQVSNAQSSNPAKYLRPIDQAILRDLARTPYYYGAEDIPIEGESGSELLEKMIGTGRCHWLSPVGPALSASPPLAAEGGWRIDDDGSQRFAFDGPADTVTLPLTPPWYLEPASGRCGPLRTGLPPRVAAALARAPAVAPTEVAALTREIADRLPDRPTLLPRSLPPAEPVAGPPRPCLRLMHRRLRYRWHYYDYQRHDSPPGTDAMIGRLSFDYGGHRIAEGDDRHRPTFLHDGRLYTVARDRRDEMLAHNQLASLGFRGLDIGHFDLEDGERSDMVLCDASGGDAPADLTERLVFLHTDLPALRADGWTVEIDDDFPLRLAEADGDWTAEIEDGTGIDWVELHLGVTVDGRRVDLVPALCTILRQMPPGIGPADLDDGEDGENQLFLPVEDGTFVPLPIARLQPILEGLLELMAVGGVDAEGRVRFSPARAAEIAALEEATAAAAGLRWLGGERMRALGRTLRDLKGIEPVTVPSSFAGALRPYQQDGVNWLQFLRTAGLGGVLADDMGLGKTVQTLAHLVVEKESGRLDAPALVVAPTSLMANWRLEAERFAPDLKVLTLHGADRKQHFEAIARHDLVLTTYPLLARDREALLGQDWSTVVLDEAQAIKNPRTAVTQHAQQLKARHRICLTGTPMENHLGELWSLFHFLSPGLLHDRTTFNRMFRTPIEKHGDAERQALLHRRVRPFLLRRTKAAVAPELPPKVETVEHIEMPPAQRDLYESIRVALHRKVREALAEKGLGRSHIILLDALLKLRQACCDPRLLKHRSNRKAGSAKLDRLLAIVDQLLREGRRILLFSQFTSMLALIGEALDAAETPYLTLTGKTRDRATLIRRFQEGEAPLFLISLKAGGTGLNLTAADTVIHYDPWWNPAVEAQATDRAHRIGQTRTVFVHKLVTLDSIEEKMLELHDRKRALADGLFGADGGSAAGITEADIAFLFDGGEPP